MAHHGFLIAIFLLLTLVVPAVIALRVFGTAFSGDSAKATEGNADNAAPSERAQDRKPAD
jgi:hypothetical protein